MHVLKQQQKNIKTVTDCFKYMRMFYKNNNEANRYKCYYTFISQIRINIINQLLTIDLFDFVPLKYNNRF